VETASEELQELQERIRSSRRPSFKKKAENPIEDVKDKETSLDKPEGTTKA
jgi:hypothetical protein